jgi:hypothetical protein
MLIIILSRHASIGGIPSGSDEKIFKTGVVLKKSSDNCKSHEPAVCNPVAAVHGEDADFPLNSFRRKGINGLTISGELLR